MIEYSVNPSDYQINTRVYGVLKTEDMIDYFEQVITKLDKHAKLIEVVNLECVEDAIFTYSHMNQIRALTDQWKQKGHQFSIFYAPNFTSSDIADMLLLVFRKVRINIHICKNEKELKDCLDALISSAK